MTNDLKNTLRLNKKTFEELPGKRFYYSPQTTWLTAAILFLFLLLYIYFLTTDYSLSLVWLIGFVCFLHFLISMLHKVIFKNPIFIINGQKLFYTKKEKWYDLTKCKVDERFIGKLNFYRTLKVECGDDSFYENYWYIEYDDDLKKIMGRYYVD